MFLLDIICISVVKEKDFTCFLFLSSSGLLIFANYIFILEVPGIMTLIFLFRQLIPTVT